MAIQSYPTQSNSNSEIRRWVLRAQFMDQLAEEGVHIALPVKLCGIDFLAYTLPHHANSPIAAVPIQFVAMAHDIFLREFAALRTSGLLVVLLEEPGTPRTVTSFALAAPELMLVQMAGLIATTSDNRGDSRSKLSALRRALEPYEMVFGKWRSRIDGWIVESESPYASA